MVTGQVPPPLDWAELSPRRARYEAAALVPMFRSSSQCVKATTTTMDWYQQSSDREAQTR